MPIDNRSFAIKFIILLGFVSLFADITSHGAKSISGAYLALLGANAFVVSSVAGFGELLAYGLRLFSGYFVDKTARYWLVTILGYACNLFAVPLLAFAGSWRLAAFLIVLERVGKAVRTPARDAMLSHASNEIGMGSGFGLHQALDQIGAMLGPLVIAVILFFHKDSYRLEFALLFLPALIALLILFYAGKIYPHPQDLEITPPHFKRHGITKTFWIYIFAGALVAAGYADFPLAAYHFTKSLHLAPAWIPLLYAVAMLTSAISALFFGRLYDYKGFYALMAVVVVASFFAPLIFLGGLFSILLGMALWGFGMGAQASLMKAVIGDLVAKEKRGAAYGLFNAAFGIAWFLGSVLMGFLYDISIHLMVLFSVAVQLLSLPFFAIAMLRVRDE